MSERPIQRSSPPFGELPSLVQGDLELLVTFERGSFSLAGFFCSPHGVTASFRAALLARDETATPFAFEYHTPPVATTALDIWAQQLGDEDQEAGSTRTSRAVAGERTDQSAPRTTTFGSRSIPDR